MGGAISVLLPRSTVRLVLQFSQYLRSRGKRISESLGPASWDYIARHHKQRGWGEKEERKGAIGREGWW